MSIPMSIEPLRSSSRSRPGTRPRWPNVIAPNVLSLDRVGEIRGELLMMWGRQDPHIPREGRDRIHAALEDAGTRFSWVEVNGQHAFGRDEGHRYDPELARQCLGHVLDLFHRRLGQDEEMVADSGPVETRH